MKKKKSNKPAYRTSVGSSTDVYLYVQTGIQEQILGMLGMKTMPENLDEIANLLKRKKELLYSYSCNSVA
jgi:23S rRNA maturation mini-RNase III